MILPDGGVAKDMQLILTFFYIFLDICMSDEI